MSRGVSRDHDSFSSPRDRRTLFLEKLEVLKPWGGYTQSKQVRIETWWLSQAEGFLSKGGADLSPRAAEKQEERVFRRTGACLWSSGSLVQDALVPH